MTLIKRGYIRILEFVKFSQTISLYDHPYKYGEKKVARGGIYRSTGVPNEFEMIVSKPNLATPPSWRFSPLLSRFSHNIPSPSLLPSFDEISLTFLSNFFPVFEAKKAVLILRVFVHSECKRRFDVLLVRRRKFFYYMILFLVVEIFRNQFSTFETNL